MGLAFGDYRAGVVTVREARTGGGGEDDPLTVIQRWIRGASGKVLLKIDAPLGWPIGMRTALRHHVAGEPIAVPPHDMFRRLTDVRMKERLRKTPLDVGADRIARTAHKALSILGSLRKDAGQAVPLAWDPVDLPRLSAIEIYPAALLAAFELDASSYKKPETDKTGRDARRALLGAIEEQFESTVTFAGDRQRAMDSADALDAFMSVIAGAEFLSVKTVSPATDLERDRARIEGWIWTSRSKTELR